MKVQAHILGLLRGRCEQAIEEMNRVYGPLCRRISGNILSSPEDVEEVLSDTFLVAWNRIPPEEPHSLGAYLSKITRNLSMAKLRNNHAARRDPRLTVTLSELEECIPAPDTPERAVEYKLLTQVIDDYLGSLTPLNRFLFIRRYYYLDSCKEIARAARLSEQAVRTRLMRLREGLRTYLQKEELME